MGGSRIEDRADDTRKHRTRRRRGSEKIARLLHIDQQTQVYLERLSSMRPWWRWDSVGLEWLVSGSVEALEQREESLR